MMVASSVLILAILLLRRVTRGRISMRLRYALWLVAALRLLLPVPLGNSAVSVMKLLPENFRDEAEGIDAGADQPLKCGRSEKIPEADMDLTASGEEDVMTQMNTDDRDAAGAPRPFGQAFGQPQKTKDEEAGNDEGRIQSVFLIVWILGVLSVGGYMAVSQARFVRILHLRRREAGKEKIPQRFAAGFARRGIKVYQVKGLASPCLVGRNIYIGTQLFLEKQKFTHILAHEYCHAVHHDTLWAFLRSALAAVYWFHPLVWAAAFAARQDSELACDEAVISLLGEKERFAYGRTLLYLLSCGCGQIDCAGTSLAMEGRKRGVRERVDMIARNSDRKRWMAAAVIVTMLLVCGCAFTGSEQESDVLQAGENGEEGVEEMIPAQEDMPENVTGEDRDRGGTAYEEVSGGDDSERLLDRRIDIQAYYEYQNGDPNGGDNPLEDGWYLVCSDPEEKISLYGLYTEESGCRGVKTVIGGDVNTYDIVWCPSTMNGDSANIRVLEEDEDGLPRRFVFKLLSKNTSDSEIWNLYSCYKLDTGTLQMEEFTADAYREWADGKLSFAVDEERGEVQITYEGDAIASLDISAYQDQKVEEVLVSPDVVGFELNSDAYEGEAYGENAEGYEGVVIHLAVGLRLEGLEGVWFDSLSPLTVQVLCHQEKEAVFAMQMPKIDTRRKLGSPMQRQKMEEIREGIGF